uniref:Uncharacterized protein n=1 Tax=Arundo donax TaxID=35708 RepID=A0A0A9CZM8_ARUDO
MELEDLDEDEDNLGQEGTKVLFGGNACAEKLDGLMVVVCEHLKSYSDDRLRKMKPMHRSSNGTGCEDCGQFPFHLFL